MTKQDQFDFLFKIVMIGDSGVGKSNLLSRYVDNTFNVDSKPTIGVEFATKSINIDGKNIKNQIWDTAGQERFRAITNAYYRGAVGAIIAFDLTKSKTFENVQKWLSQLRENAEPRITIMLLGNKSDLTQTREVKVETIHDYVDKNKLLYLQTSAANGTNVAEAFSRLIQQIYKKQKLETPEPRDDKNNYNTVNSQKGTKTNDLTIKSNYTSTSAKKPDTVKLENKPAKSDKKKSCC